MGKKSKTKEHRQLKTENMVVRTMMTELLQKCVSPTSSKNPSPKEQYNALKEILSLLEKIEKLKNIKGEISQLPEREKCIESFYDWAKHKNISFENLEIKKAANDELGIFAKAEFNKGDMFTSIPREAMMTSESVLESQIGQLVKSDPMLSSMPNVALAMYLLYELYHDKSQWKAYIQMLPRCYSNVLYFSTEDLENLKSTSVFLEAEKIMRSIIRQYAYLSTLLYKNPLGKDCGFIDKLTFDDYRWAVSTLMTRQNPVPPSNGCTSPVLALIPFLDMCNHKEGPVSVDYNGEAKQCECYVAAHTKPGDELHIFYGPRPNTELVIYNGFFYEDNTHDYIKMKFHLSKTDTQYDIKKSLVAKLGLDELLPICCMPSPIKDQLQAFLQIANASEMEVSEMLKLESIDLAQSLGEGGITGKDTKIKGLKFLKERCSLAWRLLSTVGNGQVNGEEKDVSHTKALSILLKENEKKLLKDSLEYIDKEIENILGRE